MLHKKKGYFIIIRLYNTDNSDVQVSKIFKHKKLIIF